MTKIRPLQDLIRNTSGYMVSEVLIIASSLISFPIFVNIFEKSEYGQMLIIMETLTLVQFLAIGGLPQSAVRFFPTESKDRKELSVFRSTILKVSLLLSIICTLLLVYACYIIPVVYPGIASRFGFNALKPGTLAVFGLLILSSWLLIARAPFRVFLGFYRANMQVKLYNFLYVGQRYLSLIVSIIFVVVFHWGLVGLYSGMLVIEGGFAIGLIIYFLWRRNISLTGFDGKLAMEAYSFGVPIVLLNTVFLLFNNGDLYLINYFLGDAKVAEYGACYRLTTFVLSIIFTPMISAMTPIYLKTWKQQGEKVTAEFLSKAMRGAMMVVLPVSAGTVVLSPKLIAILAPEYTNVPVMVLVSWIAAGLGIRIFYYLGAAGLYIHKKVKYLAYIVFYAAIFNILLNYFLIPGMGILGAAVATLISYIFLCVATVAVGMRYLKFKIPYIPILLYLAGSVIMFTALFCLPDFFEIKTLDVVAKAAIGAIIYGIYIFGTDSWARNGILRKIGAKR